MLAFAADTMSGWDLHLMLCPLAEAAVSSTEHTVISSCYKAATDVVATS